MKTTVGIIGGGNMGSAIIRGIRGAYKVIVCEADTKKAARLRRQMKVPIKDLEGLSKSADIIILAVKPQDMEDVLRRLAGHVASRHVIISIAAGITTTYIQKRLGFKVKVVRTMPNLPLQIGQGITAVCRGRFASPQDVAKARRIFDCIGQTVIVQEKQINAVTAVSGSGPAYVFLFAEVLMQAARSLGLDKKLSQQLVAETLSGSVHLMRRQQEEAAELRKRVTSKAGTTEAALKVLWAAKIDIIYKQALKAAAKRAGELSLT